MDTVPTTGTTTTATATGAAARSAAAGASAGAASASKPRIASDFDTFLRLLTTQLKNQDPLNPMESTDFAVQLATFSEVEQTQRSNELLETMTGQLGMSGMAQLANWVGMEVRSASPVEFEGVPLTLVPNHPAGSESAILVVRNATGTIVSQQAIPVTSDPVVWDGRTLDGTDLPKGRYSFELESRRGGAVVSTTPIETYGRIVEARAGTNGPVLVLAGGVEVATDKVTAMRRP